MLALLVPQEIVQNRKLKREQAFLLAYLYSISLEYVLGIIPDRDLDFEKMMEYLDFALEEIEHSIEILHTGGYLIYYDNGVSIELIPIATFDS